MTEPRAKKHRMRAITLRLENFRLFRDSGEFPLAPLTCLVGANSSGKSSIISALLLLKQSLEQEQISSRVTPLALSGPYCDLGSFRDVVHAHKVRSHIRFSFEVPVGLLDQFQEDREPLVPLEVPRSALEDYGSFWDYYDYSRQLKRALPARGTIDVSLSFVTDAPFGPSLSRIDLRVPGIGSVYFRRTTGGERPQHWRVYTDGLPKQSLGMHFYPRRFFPVVSMRPKVFERSAPLERRKLRRFHRTSNVALDYLRQLLSSIEVVGPFRTPPERRYPFAGFSSSKSGPRGEQAIALLITEQLLKTPKHPLRSTVSFWLQHLNLAQNLTVESLVKNMNLFQLNLEGAGRSPQANVADVGYGISQVLPVIVQGLLMRPGDVYVVQQPELHLHPDAQAGLADFFLYLSSYGIRVVVETHSEYMLIRLRRRLAERKLDIGRTFPRLKRAKLPLSREAVAVLLCTAGRRRLGAKVTELAIGKSFQFENLPKDFMGQALADRVELLKAAGSKE